MHIALKPSIVNPPTRYTRGEVKVATRRGRQSVVASSATSTPTLGAARRRKLGDSDLMVSECCLGTMTWGGSQNTETDAHAQLSYAFDQGINWFDTAEIYPVPPSKETQGNTDRYISTWLKTRRREDIIVATKVSGYGRQDYLRADGSTPRVNEKNIVESVDSSLERLGTDYIDLLQIHWPDRYVSLFGAGSYDPQNEREGDVPFDEQLRALERVIKDGKVRYVGVSNETSYGVMSFCHAAETLGLPKIVSIQNSYSLLVRSAFETDLAETCRRNNIGLLAYSPLAGGALSGKYINNENIKGRFNLFPGYMKRYQSSLAQKAVSEYCQVAAKYGITPTQLALAWCKNRWFVASTIIGATTMEQLKENIAAFDVELEEDVVADIDAVYRRFRDPAFN
jgi:aryl-alcohol dehydrogenase-like predicted oxidoreductase